VAGDAHNLDVGIAIVEAGGEGGLVVGVEGGGEHGMAERARPRLLRGQPEAALGEHGRPRWRVSLQEGEEACVLRARERERVIGSAYR